MFSFGMMCDPGPKVGDYARFAEDRGFSYFWVPDSPIGWREMSPYMTLAVLNTETSIIGACCTNPVSRHVAVNASLHATLQELSGGRIVLGLGKGDSAVRRLGERPAKLKELAESAIAMQDLASGQEIEYRPETPGQEEWHEQGADQLSVQLTWAPKQRMPLYIAGYGPKILQWSGEVADGIFVQIAEPSTIEWAIDHLRVGAEKAGRDVREIEIVCCTPSVVRDDIGEACELARAFPALVSNHVLDMLRFYDRSELPANLVRCLEGKGTYDYRHHNESTSEAASVISDELVDSFCVVGPPAHCASKLRQLSEIGVTQLCIYFFGVDEEEMLSTIQTYSDEIIPAVNDPA